MAYNRTIKSGDNVYGDYRKVGYQTYKPKNHQKEYGVGDQHRYSVEIRKDNIDTTSNEYVKNNKAGNIDHFEKRTSSKRPIQTTAKTHRG